MKKKPKYRKAAPEEIEFIKGNYLKYSYNELGRKIGRSDTFVRNWIVRLGLVIPEEILQKRIESSRFKKGQKSHNKGGTLSPEVRRKIKHTWFRKGSKPHNTLPEGTVTVRWNRQGWFPVPYLYIKLKDGMSELHRHIWREAHGPIPRGKVIAFRDGNTMNCSLDNLEMISMKENMVRNSRHSPEERLLTQLKIIRKLIDHLKKEERMNMLKLNEKLYDTLEKLESGKIEPAVVREIVRISNAINSNAKLMVEVAKLTSSPETHEAIQKLSGQTKVMEVASKTEKKDLWSQKTDFARTLGYKSVGDAIAALGREGFREEFESGSNGES